MSQQKQKVEFFTYEDFLKAINHNLTLGTGFDGKYISLMNVLSIINAKLEREGAWFEGSDTNGNRRTSLSLDIRQIVREECKHLGVQQGTNWYKCSQCGKNLTPNWKVIE